MTPLQVIPPRVALADPRTGLISREWYLFFLRVFERTEEPALALDALTDRVEVVEADVVALEAVDVAFDVRADALEARALAHTVEDEGVPLTQRATLNFAGSGVTVTDTGTKTLVTIAGGGGSGGGNAYFPSGF